MKSFIWEKSGEEIRLFTKKNAEKKNLHDGIGSFFVCFLFRIGLTALSHCVNGFAHTGNFSGRSILVIYSFAGCFVDHRSGIQ